jgi:hypothetical protein
MRGLHVYLMLFSVRRELVEKFLWSRPEVEDWLRVFPGAVLVKSSLDAESLVTVFRQALPNFHFLLTDVDQSMIRGEVRPEIWDFMKSAPRERTPIGG